MHRLAVWAVGVGVGVRVGVLLRSAQGTVMAGSASALTNIFVCISAGEWLQIYKEDGGASGWSQSVTPHVDTHQAGALMGLRGPREHTHINTPKYTHTHTPSHTHARTYRHS